MKSSLPNTSLTDCYEQFSRGHQQRREQLLESLPAAEWQATPVQTASHRPISPAIFTGVKLRFALRTALAAAAVLMIVFGAVHIMKPDAVNPQAAWATTLKNGEQLQSIHFKMVTPSSKGKDPMIEMWWRRTGGLRILFHSNNMIWTNNGKKVCRYIKDTNTLDYLPPGSTGPIEMFVQGYLGKLFAGPQSLAHTWLRDGQIIDSEKILYKGEKCLKITTTLEGDRFEYIIDESDVKPLIYEMHQYSSSGRLKCHVQVLEMDRKMDDSLFVIDPAGKTIRSDRSR